MTGKALVYCSLHLWILFVVGRSRYAAKGIYRDRHSDDHPCRGHYAQACIHGFFFCGGQQCMLAVFQEPCELRRTIGLYPSDGLDVAPCHAKSLVDCWDGHLTDRPLFFLFEGRMAGVTGRLPCRVVHAEASIGLCYGVCSAGSDGGKYMADPG